MKRVPFATTALALVIPVLLAAAFRVQAASRTGLVHWQPSMDAARDVAQAQHKPILLLQMFGRLDEELC